MSITIPATAQHTATVIFSHGLKDTSETFQPFLQKLADALPHVKVILPQAPTRPITFAGGAVLTSWFDLRAVPPTDPALHDVEGILESATNLRSLIAKEIEAGIPAERIVIGGFSQGSGISLITALTSNYALAGVVGLSGFLGVTHEDKIVSLQTPESKSIPFFWGHGDNDPIIPLSLGERGVQYLKEKLNVKQVDLHVYSSSEHNVVVEEEKDVIKFVSGLLQ